ncbi:hypothetical protein [Lelliottia wanjuensis]
MTLIEMDGFLRGKCLPGDMKVNETNAEYLLRKMNELQQKLKESERYGRQEDITIENLERKVEQLAAENAALKQEEIPLGAIENGRAFADRLEAYPFECQGGNLNMCSDWQELRRCFEHLSEWAMHGHAETPATDAILSEVRASGVDAAIEHLHKKFEGTGRVGVPVMALEWLAKEIRQEAK